MVNNFTEQNQQLPLTWKHWTQRRPRRIPMEIYILIRDMYYNVAGLHNDVERQYSYK